MQFTVIHVKQISFVSIFRSYQKCVATFFMFNYNKLSALTDWWAKAAISYRIQPSSL